METAKIERINELYRNSKAEGLTEEEIKEQQEEIDGLLEDVKKALDGKVEEVTLRACLKTHPVFIWAKGKI